MNRTKLRIALLLLLLQCLAASAQSTGTVSTYSRFGLGLLHDQSPGWSRAMGGAALGVRVGNRINVSNPASYSSIDSLCLLFDIGMSGSFGKMEQDTKKAGVNSATFDYVHVGMHVARKLGLAIGFMPYTSIGYDFMSPEQTIAKDVNTTQAITTGTSYSGSGGLNMAYAGLGWKALRDFSVGVNVGFLWGKYDHMSLPWYSEGGSISTSYSTAVKMYSAKLKSYKIDFGAQYSVRLSPQDWLNIGATVGVGHKVSGDATLLQYSTKGDSTSFKASSPFDIPFSYGLGAAWQHKNTLLVAADVHQEQWGDCHMPVETSSNYMSMKGSYKNRTKIAAGVQWTPDPFVKNYLMRIQYRAGINFSTPYIKVNGQSGPSELRLGVGAGLPITNKINNRSVVNIGLNWLRRSASGAGMVKEDYFVINLGMTFNERWFMKYKIE